MEYNLDFDALVRALNTVSPPLYYATDEQIEQGKVLWAQKSKFSPEFIIVHPDDIETVRKNIIGRRLIHIRDCPD